MSAPERPLHFLLAAAMLIGASCSGPRGPRARQAGEQAPNQRGMGRMMPGPMPMMRGGGSAESAGVPPSAAAPAAPVEDCPATDQVLVDQGRRVFGGAGNCFACHGARAAGTAVAPNLTDETWLDIDGSYGAIITLVRSGVPHPKQYPAPMPPTGGARLTSEEVCAVAAYVYSRSHPPPPRREGPPG